MNKIAIEYETEIQYKTLLALTDSFESGSINMDKFLMWVKKSFNPGTSIILSLLDNLSEIL